IARDLMAEASNLGLECWAAETHVLSVDQWNVLGKLATAGRLVEGLRLIKDDAEVAALSKACEISTRALERLWQEPLRGRSEKELALRLEILMREGGADDRAFDTIVATGTNSAIPHHQPTERRVAEGDFLKIDFGA